VAGRWPYNKDDMGRGTTLNDEHDEKQVHDGPGYYEMRAAECVIFGFEIETRRIDWTR